MILYLRPSLSAHLNSRPVKYSRNFMLRTRRNDWNIRSILQNTISITAESLIISSVCEGLLLVREMWNVSI
jgi:hypothetical protein